MKPRFLVYAIACLIVLTAAQEAVAQEEQRHVSQCQAIAQSIPRATFASFTGPAPITGAGATDQSVTLTYIGHSTFFIETPGGVTIATDYSGWYSPPRVPMVVTMNRAHSSHYSCLIAFRSSRWSGRSASALCCETGHNAA